MKNTKKLNNSEVAAFCSQLSLLLPAGITPYESIHLMAEDTETENGKAILQSIEKSLYDGQSLHEALAETKVFPEYVVSMILLGEESGNLDIITKKLADYYEQQCTISESIKNAVSYPLIMIVLMLLILVVLLTKILPIFNQVFIQLGSELTGVSRSLMNIGTSIQVLSGFFIVLLVLCAAIALFVYNNQKAKIWFKRCLHTGRFTKSFFLDISYSRFASAFSLITAGGLDTFKGIELAAGLIDNEIMLEKIKKCSHALLEGGYVYEAIKDADIFQAKHQRMLQLAYRSGSTDEVLSQISEHYEYSTISRLQRLLGAIEPTLVIVFSLIVGLVLMSVIMPLIGIMSGIG